MFCDRCGAGNRDDARFCRGCGEAIGLPPAGAGTTDRSPSVELTAVAPATPAPAIDAVPEPLARALSGQYVIEKLLGRGGMGAVWLARELALDRHVAIKVLPDHLAVDPKAVQRFQQEARLAAKLRHPNIVTIHTVGEAAGFHFFTMAFIEGATLDAWIAANARSPQPEDGPVWRVAREIFAAVDAAHRQQVVHRDLKPSNIMIDGAGHLFVMDFGLAKRQGDTGLTSHGMIVGTPRYMSPEQIRGEPATTGSDIYALGLILFELITGRPLIEGATVTAIVAEQLGRDFRAAVSSEPRIPGPVGDLLLRMIERDPGRRIGSVTEVLEAIESARHRASGDSTPTASWPLPPITSPPPGGSEPPATTPSPTPRRHQARERIRNLLDRLDKKS